jgi:hypothetical protein
MTADNRSHKVKKRYQISNCRFRFGEAMLVGTKFNVVQNMMANNEFKQLWEISEKRNGSAVAQSGTIAPLEYGYNSIEQVSAVQSGSSTCLRTKPNLRDFSPQANYTDRATDLNGRILGFLAPEPLLFHSSCSSVILTRLLDPVPDPLLLR